MTEEQLIQEFQAIEDAFNVAVVSNDVREISKCVSDDWVMVEAQGGIVLRERFFHAVNKGTLSHSAMTKKVMRVKVYDGIAVVTGRGQNNANWKGEELFFDEWVTDIYRKENGRWVCVLTHLTPVAK